MVKESHAPAAGQTVVVVKEKRSLLTKIFGFGCLGIVVIIIIVAVASSMGDDKPTNDFPAATSTPTTKSEYAVGEEVKQDNIALTVTDVQRNYPSGNEFTQPESGKEFVRVNVKLVNNSGSSHSYGTSDFKMQDSTGNRLYTTFVSEVPNELSGFAELASGGSVVGNIVFQVPRDDKNLKLVFNPSFWGTEVIVKL